VLRAQRTDLVVCLSTFRSCGLQASSWRRESPRYGSQVRYTLLRHTETVCIDTTHLQSGGEPTVRVDLEDIAARLGALPGLQDLGITTNGILLTKKLPGATCVRHWPAQFGLHIDSLYSPNARSAARSRFDSREY